MAQAPKIVVHCLDFGRSRLDRVVWLLEELKFPYDFKVHYTTRPGFGNAPDSLKAISPLAKSPLLTIDGKLFEETGATVRYLLSEYWTPECGLQKSSCARAGYDSAYWSFFSEGTLMQHMQPGLRNLLTAMGLKSAKGDEALSDDVKRGVTLQQEAYQAQVTREMGLALGAAEEYIQTHQWFSGTDEPGEGDFMMIFPVYHIAYGTKTRPYPIGPATEAWLARVTERPAWQRTVNRIKTEIEAQKPAKL